MRRIAALLGSGILAASLVSVVALPAGAQTGDLAAFCAARVEFDGAQQKGKAAALAALDKIVAAAPAAVIQPVTEIRDGFKKKGDKAFEQLDTQLAAADDFIYNNCPGAKVAVTAVDYEFQGVPATLAAGPTNFKMTNGATDEDHEMGIVRLTAAGAAMDPEKLLALSEKKQAKFLDFSTATGMFAQPGASGYTIADLQPGTYVYACFLPLDGKKNGKPHFTQGMYGSFTVK